MNSPEELERQLSELPRPELSRDLAPAILDALRREGVARPVGPGRRLSPRLAWAGGGLLAGLALGVILFFLLGAPGGDRHLGPGSCRVRQVSGEVHRVAAGQRSPVRMGEVLHAQDLVSVGDDSRAELDLDPDARVILHAATAVRLVRLEPAMRSLELELGRVSVELLDGGRRAVQVTHRPSRTLVEGRQGAFDALALEGGRAVVAVRKGQAEVVAGERRLPLQAGLQVRLAPGTEVPTPVPVRDTVEISLREPQGALVASAALPVAGQADTHARVWLNGRPIALDAQGRFAERVRVKPGQHLELVAEDVLGNRRSLSMGPALAMAADVPGPAPVDQPPEPAVRPHPPAEALQPERRVEIRDYKVQW
ncbi:MAG TPA: FecR domain-containing protein [Myxococcota bacterium]|nr:FecR domain-containing protein [Myxococcota bacterium]HRY92552.1 FecR domain-containing protein [Myxococcota bacterium]HSA23115.1 FecR domain-containing protein [Myxococcota bacterium]